MNISKLVTLFCFAVLGSLAFACSDTSGAQNVKKWMSPNGKIKALSTIAMIEDLIRQVGGDHVDTLTLVTGELDPHTYQLVKGDDEKLAYADVIFYNGLGLEHGPSLRNFLAESDKTVGLGDLIRQESPETILYYNGTVDPHIWMDIQLWAKAVKYIVRALEKIDPAHAQVYRQNGDALEKYLLASHEQLKAEMAEVPPRKRYLVTSHDAFNYFARSYLATAEEGKTGEWQKRFAAPEGLAPESQLSTNDIRFIIEHMKKYNVQVIFPESNVSQASIRKLVSAGLEEGLKMWIAPDPLYGDAMGAPGSSGDTYSKMISHNIKTIAKHLHKNESSE